MLEAFSMTRSVGSGSTTSYMRLAGSCYRTMRLESTYYNQKMIGALSLVGSVQFAQSIRAMILTQRVNYCSISGSTYYFEEKERYRVYIHKLPKFNQCHLVAVCDRPSWVFGEKTKALESYLLGQEITTPVMPSWIPWIAKQLEEFKLLRRAEGSIEGYYCDFKTSQIDEMVSMGLKKHVLKLAG